MAIELYSEARLTVLSAEKVEIKYLYDQLKVTGKSYSLLNTFKTNADEVQYCDRARLSHPYMYLAPCEQL